MSKKRILCLSVIIGAVMEGAIIGLGTLFAKFGPCGPGNYPADIFMLIHVPGWQIAKRLSPESSSLDIPIAIFVTSMIWSLLAFAVLSWKNCLRTTAK